MVHVQWRLREFLEANNLTAYQLWKQSGLSKTGLYNLTTPQGLARAKGVDFETLGKIMHGLEALTGQHITLEDILEVKRDAKSKR